MSSLPAKPFTYLQIHVHAFIFRRLKDVLKKWNLSSLFIVPCAITWFTKSELDRSLIDLEKKR